MESEPMLDEYRTGYIAARWNVSDNCARALQLFEVGYTNSGAASILGVTEGTVSSYNDELCDKIHNAVVYPITASKPRFDVYGRPLAYRSGSRYSDGEAHGEAVRQIDEDTPVTSGKEQVDPSFREQPPLNKGADLEDIDGSLVTIPGAE